MQGLINRLKNYKSKYPTSVTPKSMKTKKYPKRLNLRAPSAIMVLR